ncbi:hypothetical protein VYU27_009747, partial [Nannochloropsis oceanica]
ERENAAFFGRGREGGRGGGRGGGREGGREGGVEVASLELIAEQLALADRVLLNKMDLLEGEGGREGGREGLREYVGEMAPGAVLLECVKGEVEIEQLLGLEAFSLAKTTMGREEGEGGGNRHGRHDEEGGGGKGHQHTHAQDGKEGGREGRREGHVHKRLGFTSIGIEVTDGPLEWAAFEQWLGTLLTKSTQPVVAAPGETASPSLAPSASLSIDEVAAPIPTTAASTSAPAPGEDPSTVPPSTQQQRQQRQQQEQKRVVLQGIYGHLEMDEAEIPPSLPSSPSPPPCSKLVVIGRFGDAGALKKEMERGLLECLAPGWYSKR